MQNEYNCLGLAVRSLQCPVCLWKCKEDEGLGISFTAEFDGMYCRKCYAKWISECVPKMNSIIDPLTCDSSGELKVDNAKR